MRMKWLGVAALAIAAASAGGCADSPTLPGLPPHDEAAVFDGVEGCVSDGECLLPPISSGGGDACDPTLGPCDEGGGGSGECIESISGDPMESTISGCEGGGPGDGGGSGSGDGSTTTPAPSGETVTDTCYTTDPIVDDPAVFGEFANLWSRTEAEGVEQGGWIVQESPGQFMLIPFQNATYTPCGIDVFEEPPSGTVSVLHTHPWAIGEVTSCGYQYFGTPSRLDELALKTYGWDQGYFLDATGIGRYEPDRGEYADRLPRCGY